MKKKLSILFSILIACYFGFVIIMSMLETWQLKKNGVFASVRIEELKGCGKSECYAKTIFSSGDSYHTYKKSYMRWDGKKERGDMFLIIYLKDRPNVNYVFWDISLPSDLDLDDDVSEYIPEDISINFLRM